MDEEIELRRHGYVLMDELKMRLLSKVALIFSVVVSSLFALPVLLPSSRSLFARVSVPTGFG